MPRAVRLLGVGHVALDHVWTVDAPPVLGGKTSARTHTSLIGGMTANAAIAAARLGAAVRVASPLGDDDTATRCEEALRAEGIATDALVRVTGASSSVSSVVVDATGARTIVTHRGAALEAPPTFDARCLDGVDAVFADPRCPAWAAAALEAARVRGIAAVFDGDTSPRATLARLAGRATWTVFSEPGAAAYLGASGGGTERLRDAEADAAIVAALESGAAFAVVTLGERGLRWARAGGGAGAPLRAFDVAPVVDTLAAGDVFHGALAVALAEGAEPLDALRFASAAAAIKCTRAGGAQGAPRREAVLGLLGGAAAPA